VTVAIGFFTLDYLISIAPRFKDRSRLEILELGEAGAYFFDLALYLDRIAEASAYPRAAMDTELALARARSSSEAPYAEAQLI
jgi:hypothetical protein